MFQKAEIEIYDIGLVDVLTTSGDIPIDGIPDWDEWEDYTGE